jgi:hypothetical protein
MRGWRAGRRFSRGLTPISRRPAAQRLVQGPYNSPPSRRHSSAQPRIGDDRVRQPLRRIDRRLSENGRVPDQGGPPAHLYDGPARDSLWPPDTTCQEARRIFGEVARGADPLADKIAGRTIITVAELCRLYPADVEAGRLLTRRKIAEKGEHADLRSRPDREAHHAAARPDAGKDRQARRHRVCW